MEYGLTSDFINRQKERLLEHKSGILNKLANSLQDLHVSEEDLSDEVDLGQSILGQNYALGLRERDLMRLREIELALRKIEVGEYGVCEESGDVIEFKRLERLPWARLSLFHAEEEERKLKHFAKRLYL